MYICNIIRNIKHDHTLYYAQYYLDISIDIILLYYSLISFHVHWTFIPMSPTALGPKGCKTMDEQHSRTVQPESCNSWSGSQLVALSWVPFAMGHVRTRWMHLYHRTTQQWPHEQTLALELTTPFANRETKLKCFSARSFKNWRRERATISEVYENMIKSIA